METENAINAIIAHAKKEGNYQKGDKIRIVVAQASFSPRHFNCRKIRC